MILYTILKVTAIQVTSQFLCFLRLFSTEETSESIVTLFMILQLIYHQITQWLHGC